MTSFAHVLLPCLANRPVSIAQDYSFGDMAAQPHITQLLSSPEHDLACMQEAHGVENVAAFQERPPGQRQGLWVYETSEQRQNRSSMKNVDVVRSQCGPYPGK